MKPNMYNDIPYNLVRKLIDAYEQKEKFIEGSKGYMQYEEKILKLKGAIEYVAEGDK
jgi:hypothetical protein